MRTEQEVRERIRWLQDAINTVFKSPSDGKVRGEMNEQIRILKWVLNDPEPVRPDKNTP